MAMDGAASGGHLAVFQWLEENTHARCTAAAMHLEVVKWLHEHRSEGCTTEAMDGAARRGHLNVVKWLLRNRPEGCTTDAIDSAAASSQEGVTEIIMWLHKHRSDGCTTKVMDNAASHHNFDAVMLVYSQRREGCPRDAFRARMTRLPKVCTGGLRITAAMARKGTVDFRLGRLCALSMVCLAR
jgi:hypothetical protein